MIERHHLEIVEAVARTGTLTRAADELHLTQSALSHAIHRLEEIVGVRLLRREGRRVAFTDAGVHVLGWAKRIVPQLRELDRSLEAFAIGRKGLLRIGMECHPCYEWLLSLLPHFLARYPEIEVDVIQRFQFSGLDALFQREVDMIITPDPLRVPGVSYRPVLRYELLLVMAESVASENQLLSAAGSSGDYDEASFRPDALPFVSADTFLKLDLLTYPVERSRLDVFTRLLIPQGVEPHSVRAIEATELMLELVRVGRGCTTLPDWMIDSLGPGMRAFRLGSEGVRKELCLGARDDEVEQGAIAAFLDMAMES